METKRLFVEGVKTDSGKVYISSKEIGRELERLNEKESMPQENNVINLSENPQFKPGIQLWDWSEYEYVDDPNDMDKKFFSINLNGIKDFFEKCVICIEDGTKIIARRKNGGKKR